MGRSGERFTVLGRASPSRTARRARIGHQRRAEGGDRRVLPHRNSSTRPAGRAGKMDHSGRVPPGANDPPERGFGPKRGGTSGADGLPQNENGPPGDSQSQGATASFQKEVRNDREVVPIPGR